MFMKLSLILSIVLLLLTVPVIAGGGAEAETDELPMVFDQLEPLAQGSEVSFYMWGARPR